MITLGEMLNEMFPDAPDWLLTVMLWIFIGGTAVSVLLMLFLIVNLFN